jgi:hypothetical protein
MYWKIKDKVGKHASEKEVFFYRSSGKVEHEVQ